MHIDKTLWKPDDKEWMKQRAAEWRCVVKSLDVIRNEPNLVIKKRHYKYHKDLFFTGEYTITREDELHFERPFPSELLFLLWYYPEKSLESYKRIIDGHMISLKNRLHLESGVLEYSIGTRSYFMRIAGNLGFDKEYGFMGGREELITKAFFPSYDYGDTITISDDSGQRSTDIHLGPKPKDMYGYTISGLLPMFEGFDKNRYLPAQYMWDHLDFSMTKYPETLDDLGVKILVKVLYICKHHEDYRKFPHEKSHVVQFADKLRQRFCNNEFGDALMNYWNDIDALYKKYK